MTLENGTNLSDNTNLSFSSLPLKEALLTNIASLDYKNMTPIQAHSLPLMLKGNDIIAKAQTGSGKTVAFGLSLLNQINVHFFAVQALILCPTRELAEQVSHSLRQLARLIPNIKIVNLSGGIPMKPQLDSLRHGAHIIVGTPGRIQKHLDKEALLLNKLQSLVLDEADRMLDMGFFDAIKQIITQCPDKRQTLLFSATFPEEIKQLASQFMLNPQKIEAEEKLSESTIEQHFYEVTDRKDKFLLLKSILLHHQPISTLVFCNTKEQTNQLTDLLTKEGFSAIALNGDMEQVDRDMAMIRFKNQSASILVATDVAARGLDIKELPLVVNFELAFDYDVHIHRIGRTGRAGHQGLALSLTTPADAFRLCTIEEGMGQPLCWKNQAALSTINLIALIPQMVTLCINAGRKDKIRPGDILGALTKDASIPVETIGKIDITPLYSYVAVHQKEANKAYQHFQNGKIKGRRVIVKKL